MFKKPRTTQERRQSQDGYVRSKRNFHNLADAWDDILRNDYSDRSWKRYRRTQYKVISNAKSD